jgi:WD40 repeat protein
MILSGDPRENWFSVFAPDGKTLATGGAAGVLKLWDLASGNLRSASPPSREPLRCAAFAPDGQTVAIGRLSGTMTVWDARSAKPLKSVKEHSGAIRSVSFSPDGKRLVTSGQDRSLTVWETATWTPVRSLVEQPQPILSSAISPDGKLLALALGDPARTGTEGGVRLFEFDTLTERGSLPGFSGVMWTVAFSPDGQTLAVGTGPTVWLWDPATRRIRATLKVSHNVRILAFAPDGKTLVTVGALTNRATRQVEGAGQLFDVASLQPRAMVGSHGQQIVGMSVSPDGRLLSTVSNSAPEVRLWDISKVPPPAVPVVASAPAPRRNANPVAPAAPGPGRRAQLPPAGLPVAGSPPLRFRSMLAGHEGDVWFSVFAPDGQTLATGGNDQIVRLWNPQTGTQRATLAAPRELRAAAYFPDGKRLATGCANGVVQIWDVPQTKAIATLKKNPRMIRALAVAPDGKTLAVSSNAQTLVLYDTMTWAELGSLPAQEEPILGLAFSPDGKTLAMSTGHTPQGGVGSVKLLDPTSLEARTVFPVRYDVRSVAFSPDGKLLATTSLVAPDPVQLWDLSTVMPIRALKPAGFVRKLAYAPDGATLAVGQTDGIISLFDPATGHLLASSRGHAGTIFGMGISPDAKLLATASSDATVKLWDLPATAGAIGRP